MNDKVTVIQVSSLINYKSSAVAEMGDRWATVGMGRKLGGAAAGRWVPSNTIGLCGLGRDTYLFTKWHLDSSTVWPQL